MASGKDLQIFINQTLCPVCLDFFRDVVLTDCGHNFCRECVSESWEGEADRMRCPQCRQEIPHSGLRPNRLVSSVVETARRIRNTLAAHSEPAAAPAARPPHSETGLAPSASHCPLPEPNLASTGVQCLFPETATAPAATQCPVPEEGEVPAAARCPFPETGLASVATQCLFPETGIAPTVPTSTQCSFPKTGLSPTGAHLPSELAIAPGATATATRCPQHDETLKLFCETDRAALCVICAVSRDHRNHQVSPIQEAADMYKEKLKKSLTCLQTQMEEISKSQTQNQANLKDRKKKSDLIQRSIEAEFTKLHQFLSREEQLLLSRLTAKEEASVKDMELTLRRTTQDNLSISKIIAELQHKLSLHEVELLQEVTSINLGLGVDFRASSPNMLDDSKLEEFKGPLQYILWRHMFSIIHPVPVSLALDESTAHPCLLVLESEEGVVVSCGEPQPVTETPRRFTATHSVLAAHGYTQGRHYWEVGVGGATGWEVGVVPESIPRKTIPAGGWVWGLGLWEGVYSPLSPEPRSPQASLALSFPPTRLGVYLDYAGGQVSLYNAQDMSHLFTSTTHFNEKIFPYFRLEGRGERLVIITEKR